MESESTSEHCVDSEVEAARSCVFYCCSGGSESGPGVLRERSAECGPLIVESLLACPLSGWVLRRLDPLALAVLRLQRVQGSGIGYRVKGEGLNLRRMFEL